MPEAMTTTTSTSAPAASASASSSSSSSFNPFKRRAQQKEGPSSSATEGGGTSRKFQRARTTQPPRSPDRPRNRAGSATATTGMSYQPADTPQRSTPAPRAAAAAATTTTTTTTTPVPLPLPRRTPTPPPPPSSSSSDPITQAHSSLTALQTQLDHLSAHFDLNPSTLYFSPPSTSNADPILPFVPQNASYHSYIEDLTRLLLKLDGIDSNGDQGVRQRRRGLVAAIERQLESVEAIKKGEWERRQKVQQELSDRKSKVDELMRGFRGGGEPATTSR